MAAYGTSDRGEVGKGPEQPSNVTTNSLGSKPSSSKPYGTSDRDEVGKGPEPVKYNGPAQVKEIDAQIKSLITSAGEEADAVEEKYNREDPPKRADVAKEFVNLAPPTGRPIKRTKAMEENMTAVDAGMETYGDYLGEQQNFLSYPVLPLGSSLAPTSTIKNYDTFNDKTKELIKNARQVFEQNNVLLPFQTTGNENKTMSMFKNREAATYDTLYGNAELIKDGPFSGKKVTEMTLRELKTFMESREDDSFFTYNNLRAIEQNRPEPNTTALGKFQFVGQTLFGKESNKNQNGIVSNYNWDLDTVFTPAVQNIMMLQLSAETMERRSTVNKYTYDAKEEKKSLDKIVKTDEYKNLSENDKKLIKNSALKNAYDPNSIIYHATETLNRADGTTEPVIVGGVTQKGFGQYKQLDGRVLRGIWEGFSSTKKVGGKDIFGNDKREYVISNDGIENLGYEVRQGIKDFIRERKKQGLKKRDWFNMKIKPVRM